jgi:NTP pyrophosphatase (non-canonical NTP hydrolase)
MEYQYNLDKALQNIQQEVLRAKSIHPKDFNSAHEGYSVILEEIDELWEEVKKKKFDNSLGEKEATQAAAMLCRFLVEITGVR